MSNYNSIKATINANIKTNNNEEITGSVMNSVLNAMVTTLGYGYQFIGVADKDTNPGTPDAKVFYLAYSPGTYTHFGGAVVDKFCVLKYDTTWHKEDIPIVVDTGISILDMSDGDLEFADEDGNVLVLFKNGHIQTKYFNSENGGGGGGQQKSIKILFFGNSLTQDAVAYLPLLLKEIAPDLEFTIYIWYNGGQTLTNQYNNYILSPNTPCGIFSVFTSDDDSWTNYSNSKSINWVINNCDFDILVLQEYGNSGQSDATIMSAFTNITTWFANHYSKPLKVFSMMDAPARSDVSGVTTRIEHYNEVFYKNCVSQGIIPAGLAMSYACGDSALNQLGDQGMLSPDGVHAQEGLPCLLQGYVLAMWIFNELGMGLSVWGSKVRITTAIYNALNVPGANLGTGVVTGTEAQNVEAQLCAIQAFKQREKLELEALNLT